MRRALEEQYDRFPVLQEKRQLKAGALPGGQPRMQDVAGGGPGADGGPPGVAGGRTPAGVPLNRAREACAVLARLRAEGITIVLVDQDVRRPWSIAD